MEPELYRLLHIIGVGISAFATVSAVVLAFILKRSYESRHRPKFVVSYDKDDDDYNRYLEPSMVEDTGEENPTVQEELWIRLQVENTSKTLAKDVELRFLSIHRERELKPDKSRPRWWFKVSNQNRVSVSLPPRFPQPFDLVFVRNVIGSSDGLFFHLALVEYELLPWPEEQDRMETDSYNKLEIGRKYELHFAVVSSNANAKYYKIDIKVDSRLSDDPPNNHLLGEEWLKKRVQVTSLKEVNI